jgi:dsDNA-specific endonuclease/ATPase MutS2
MADGDVTISEARAALQQGFQAYRSFEFADRALAGLEGLEQNERELRARVDRAKADAEAAEKDRDARVERAEGEAAKHEERAAKMKGEADSAAGDTVQRAKQQAAQIVSDARQAAALEANRAQRVSQDSRALQDALAKSRRELADLQKRIDEAKRTIQSMLQGA